MVEMKLVMVEMKSVMVEMKLVMVEMKSDMVEMKSDNKVEMKKFHFDLSATWGSWRIFKFRPVI